MSGSKAIRRYRQVGSPASPRRMIHALSSSLRNSTSKSKRTTLGERLCHRDTETRRQGEGGMGRWSDGETERKCAHISPPLLLSVSLSLCLSFSLSLCGSVAPWLVQLRRIRSRSRHCLWYERCLLQNWIRNCPATPLQVGLRRSPARRQAWYGN